MLKPQKVMVRKLVFLSEGKLEGDISLFCDPVFTGIEIVFRSTCNSAEWFFQSKDMVTIQIDNKRKYAVTFEVVSGTEIAEAESWHFDRNFSG